MRNESLSAFMTKLVAVASERRCAYLMLKDDPFFRRIPPGSEREAIEFAFAAGQAAAQKITSQHGRSPEEIAHSLQVRVTRTDAAMSAGKAVLFSEYGDRPPAVTLYTRSIDEANRLIRDNGLAGALGLEDVTPVHLAHETLSPPGGQEADRTGLRLPGPNPEPGPDSPVDGASFPGRNCR